MYRGGTGSAGVFHPRRALKTQIGGSLQHQGGGKILRREAGVEMAEHDLVDVLGSDSRVRERRVRHAHDEALDAFVAQFAEGRVRPSHDASGHDRSVAIG